MLVFILQHFKIHTTLSHLKAFKKRIALYLAMWIGWAMVGTSGCAIRVSDDDLMQKIMEQKNKGNLSYDEIRCHEECKNYFDMCQRDEYRKSNLNFYPIIIFGISHCNPKYSNCIKKCHSNM